jgi:hypothetical protein
VPRGLADGRERSNGAHQRGGHRALRRLVAIAAGLVLVAAIVFALTRVTAGPSAPSPAVAHLGDSSTAGVFSPQHVVVSVLNGTSIGGLAKDVSDGLTAKGYRQGAITNAAVQTQRASLVSYIDAGSRAHRAANRVAAEHVARDLGLRPTAVHPANRAAIESCASGSGSGTTCRGQVIVTLGTDLATMARNAGTTT